MSEGSIFSDFTAFASERSALATSLAMPAGADVLLAAALNLPRFR